MSTNDAFETSVRWWSLAFNENNFEEMYRKERRDVNHIPKPVLYFFAIGIIVLVLLMVTDSLSAYLFTPGYNYSIWDVLAFIAYAPILIIEYIIYRIPRISFLRGSVFTVVIYLTLFVSTNFLYAEKLDYPVLSLT